MAKTNGKNWLRAKGSASGSKVTFLELFFDLVFVFRSRSFRMRLPPITRRSVPPKRR